MLNCVLIWCIGCCICVGIMHIDVCVCWLDLLKRALCEMCKWVNERDKPFVWYDSELVMCEIRTRFGGTYTKIGTIQRRLAWPLRKDDTQNREAFHIFHTPFSSPKSTLPVTTTTQCDGWCHRVHSLSILPDTPRVSYTIGPQIDRRLTSGDMWLSGCFISSLTNWSTSLTVQQWREDRVVTTEYTMTGDHCKIIQSSRRGLIDVRGDKKEAAAMYIVSKISCIGSWWCTTTVSSDDIVLVSN